MQLRERMRRHEQANAHAQDEERNEHEQASAQDEERNEHEQANAHAQDEEISDPYKALREVITREADDELRKLVATVA